MNIRPFKAVRPPPDLADRVAAPPYDVVDTEQARRLADGHPMSFLRITRPDLELPADTPGHDEAIYSRAGENYRAFLDKGYLASDPEPCLYVYRISSEGHDQTGVMAVCSVHDYASNLIRRHEKTRAATETDRTRHITAINAQAGPVFLTYRDEPAVTTQLQKGTEGEPLYDITTPEGVRHTIWRVTDSGPLIDAFRGIAEAYVADGHHRAAAALRVAREQAAAAGRAGPEADDQWFLTALFPAGQLNILPYNRVVTDLNGMDSAGFLARVGDRFDVTKHADPSPEAPRRIGMFVNGHWYGLSWDADPDLDRVGSLDVSVLQDGLLEPILGIEDPRADARIAFVGGIHGTTELETRVTDGRAAVAFSMYPTSVQQLMAVADAGGVMPPKSTWFEPKLRSGLLVHPLD